MPSLQVRDLPEGIYRKLVLLASREHRSISQETIVLLEESIQARMGVDRRARRIPEQFKGIGLDPSGLPDPVELIREQRDSR